MTYLFKCDTCGSEKELQRSVDKRNHPCYCLECSDLETMTNMRSMRRVISVPQLICEPYHLKEGNRFKGDLTDYKAYRKKYDPEKNKMREINKEWASVQAQMTGAEVVKAPEKKDLKQYAKEQGIPLRG